MNLRTSGDDKREQQEHIEEMFDYLIYEPSVASKLNKGVFTFLGSLDDFYEEKGFLSKLQVEHLEKHYKRNGGYRKEETN